MVLLMVAGYTIAVTYTGGSAAPGQYVSVAVSGYLAAPARSARTRAEHGTRTVDTEARLRWAPDVGLH